LAWGWVFPKHNPPVWGFGIGFLTMIGFLDIAIRTSRMNARRQTIGETPPIMTG
jgi:hypothetical protein